MAASLTQAERSELLHSVERPSPAKAGLLNRVEKRREATQIVRLAITLSDLKHSAVSEKDPGQFSRELDDKEKLSFHEMYATWPAEVWCELLVLLAVKFGGEVERVIKFSKTA